METSEIDELLHRYIHAETRVAANLVELDDHPTYGLLQSGAMTGHTAQRTQAALAAAPAMWHALDALRRTLDRARELRGTGRLDDERRIELEAVLTRPSVVAEVIETPLADRDLLDAPSAERLVTIEELLDEIRAVYEPIRDAIAGIDARWRDVLPRLDAAERTLAELQDVLAELGVNEPSWSQARRRTDELRRRIMDDPLSLADDTGPQLDALVQEAAREVGRLRDAHESLNEDLARTEALVARARTLRAQAATSRAEALAKVADPEGLVQVPADAAVDELARRAATLRASSNRPWHQIRADLDRWLARAERMVSQLDDAAALNNRPLAQRDELRGLLTAYRAKAAALGLIEGASVSELIDEVHNELYTAPADLSRGERLLEQLAAAVQAPAEVRTR